MPLSLSGIAVREGSHEPPPASSSSPARSAPARSSAKLAALAAKELALIADAEVTQISLADYPLPIYDGDLEAEKGVPENATKLARLIVAHQGVFIATPEYNHSLPPLLKNTIDWVSRVKHTGTMPYRHKVYAHRLHVGRADRRRARADRPPQGAGDRRSARSSSRRRSRCRGRSTPSTRPAS